MPGRPKRICHGTATRGPWAIAATAAIAAALLVPQPAASSPSLDQPARALGPVAAATFDGGRPFHGAGGDELLLFAVQPTAAPDGPQGILVANRITGREIGDRVRCLGPMSRRVNLPDKCLVDVADTESRSIKIRRAVGVSSLRTGVLSACLSAG
jgi:hypothetical protein